MNNQETQNNENSKLSDPKKQNRNLRKLMLKKHFAEALRENNMLPLMVTPMETMQINVGKVCNMSCTHCHVGAGPDRKESMPDKVVDRVIDIFKTSSIPNFDITGGAPELHPRFKEIVRRVSLPGRKVIHRCNLTAIMTKPLRDIPDILAEHKVEIAASLPCYEPIDNDKQRGGGSFDIAIQAIRHLNSLGYGKEDSGLTLNLIYNPNGFFLPGNEAELQVKYKQELKDNFGVAFNNLFALTNIPIGRFLDSLIKQGCLDEYMTLLVNAFNPEAIAPLMCRNTVSISWDGNLYDCDFNQMLDLKVEGTAPQTVFDWDTERLEKRAVVIGEHCYGCTAGAGSSCGGQTALFFSPIQERAGTCSLRKLSMAPAGA
ncbi:arsenosugar biosynthesis radical SAM protein ArsS [Desulfococcaceae bacterium HSG7]|nr:arsenosugar biosynthesis radical SAM protein ArsS [Desulfococcaceae bacterium HSG7]